MLKDRVKTTITNSPGLAGNFIIGPAVTKFQSFSSTDDGKLFDVVIESGNNWETYTDCLFTFGTSTLTRGTLQGNAVGGPFAWDNTATVAVTLLSTRQNVLTLTNVSNAVNTLGITSAATGSGPNLTATGPDPNINLGLYTKGIGNLYAGLPPTVYGGLNTSNLSLGQNNTIGNSTGSSLGNTNQNFLIGLYNNSNFHTTGNVLLGLLNNALDYANSNTLVGHSNYINVSTSTTVSDSNTLIGTSNFAGAGAVNNVIVGTTQYLSDTNVFNVFIGYSNTSNSSCNSNVVIGSYCLAGASSSQSVAIGYSGSVSGLLQLSLSGGQCYTANSVAIGGGAATNTFGQSAYSQYAYANFGDAQQGLYVLNTQTSSNTVTPLDNGNADNGFYVPLNGAMSFTGQVIAKCPSTLSFKAWTIQGIIHSETAGTATLISSAPTSFASAGSSAASLSVTLTTSSNKLVINVTGVASLVYWVATIYTTELIGT
jgi:hypothetical protein